MTLILPPKPRRSKQLPPAESAVRVARKSTRLQIADRILQIKKFILEGKHRHDIVRYSSEKWGLGERQTEKYMRKSNNEIKKAYADKSNMDIAWHIESRKNLLQYATHISDFRMASALLTDTARLQGLYEKDNTQKQPKYISASNLSDDANTDSRESSKTTN